MQISKSFAKPYSISVAARRKNSCLSEAQQVYFPFIAYLIAVRYESPLTLFTYLCTTQAGLSAAAVIAGFTWPILERAHWATTMLWHWSLTSSIFSIISSAQDRLLREFPSDTPEDGVERAEQKGDLDSVLPLVLGYMMCWVWQTPIMLMSYAWVLFLVGYLIVVLVPFYDGRNVSQSRLVRDV